ncbi:hypothetical protein ADIS_2270 [Lunatimonas lonarensis]|uniref:Uncharacterized protein n=1 Tax=Lunatimonas lonarensis TaxID=1232681 RepID=R7ZST4_9BACT|nr:hypothetical protein ADIS_2270 [Lunatimonas lonarensis]
MYSPRFIFAFGKTIIAGFFDDVKVQNSSWRAVARHSKIIDSHQNILILAFYPYL